MSHICHATECEIEVPPEMFMCRKHWFSLPKNLRNKIWRTYRNGQCNDWNISHEYANVARECIRYIANKENKIPDVSIYDMLDPEKS